MKTLISPKTSGPSLQAAAGRLAAAHHPWPQAAPPPALPSRARFPCSQAPHTSGQSPHISKAQRTLTLLRGDPIQRTNLLTPEEPLAYSFCFSFNDRVRCSHSKKQGVVEDGKLQRKGGEGSRQPCDHSQPNKKLSWLGKTQQPSTLMCHHLAFDNRSDPASIFFFFVAVRFNSLGTAVPRETVGVICPGADTALDIHCLAIQLLQSSRTETFQLSQKSINSLPSSNTHPPFCTGFPRCLSLPRISLPLHRGCGRETLPQLPRTKAASFFRETPKLCPHAPADLGRGWSWVLIPLQVQFSFGQGRTFPAPNLQKFVSSTGILER